MRIKRTKPIEIGILEDSLKQMSVLIKNSMVFHFEEDIEFNDLFVAFYLDPWFRR